MAMSLGQGGGRSRSRYRPLAEINVTPLVDVMLVLLIIFMVTAPLMTSSINVDLPKANATPINQDSTPITVSVDAQGQVFMGDTPVQLPDLVTRLEAMSQDQKDRRIFVRGDKSNSYGRIIEVMGTIVQGGFTKVALLSEAPNLAPAAQGTGSTSTTGTPASGTSGNPATSSAPAAPASPGTSGARAQPKG